MNLIKFAKILSWVTILSLISIHQQMQIFGLAYQGKVKEQKIKNLVEDNGLLTYKILSLTSAHHLGDKILVENSKMEFLDPGHVIHPGGAGMFAKQEVPEGDQSAQGKTSSLLSLLSLNARAEAKPR
ncbi:MAG: hypothetical protein Q7S13_01595 [Candidatus Omnitrophota bacterium]|nr:hypothetical protein [Candidatus Omnitrophota bacterium]